MRRTTRWLLSAGVACAVLALAVNAREATSVPFGPADTWPMWRGPSGQAYSDDTRVPLTWGDTKNLLWKCDLPARGNSTPIVWGDRVFLTAASPDGRERFVLCVQAGDGKVLWQRLAATDGDPGRSHPWNLYASASCATDGTHVFACFGTPGLFCYDFEGNLIWKHSFGTFVNERGWGFAASPVVLGDLVLQNCDNGGPAGVRGKKPPGKVAPAALVALDKATGKVRWQAERNQGIGYSTPVLVPTAQGRADLVLNSPQGVWAYDPANGEERWHCDRKGDQARFGEPMPVFNGDTLFEVSGRPGPMQAIRLGGEGDVTGTHLLWQVPRKGHRDVASPVLWRGLLYQADHRGMLTCYEAATGKVVYEERLGAKALASPVVVRGKLLFLLENGMTVVVEPGREFKVVGRNRLGQGGELDFIASPAVAGGRLFLRSQSCLYCVAENNQGGARLQRAVEEQGRLKTYPTTRLAPPRPSERQ